MKKIDLSIFSWLGVLGILLRKHSPWFLLLTLFFLLAFIPKNKELKDKKYKEFYKTDFLSNFNPFVLFQIIKQILGELYLRIVKSKNKQTNNKYILPFEGRWNVANGGLNKNNSHSWELITQRYAYDFVIQNEEKSYLKDKNNIQNYLCYNIPIIASFKGKVVSINNKTKDYEKVGDFSVDWKTNNIAGNYVIIEHSNNEYSFYAHLKKDSIKVKINEVIEQGQIIAHCGNSGRSTEPHLHFQIMNSKNFFFGKSLIICFESVLNQKGESVEFLEKDMIVENKNGYQHGI